MMAAMTTTGSVARAYGGYNKYGHLTWKESRPENTELRHRNEAERARAREARTT